MHKIVKSLSLVVGLCFAVTLSYAQLENAVSWDARYTPSSGLSIGDEITLEFKAKVDAGFTIYSAFPPEDWPSLGTEFALDETSSGIELVGRLDEKGDKKTKYDDIFEADISYFEKEVTFFHKVKVTAPSAKIEGFLRYQVCDDSKCVPGTYDFSYQLAASKQTEKVEKKEPPKQEETTQIEEQEPEKTQAAPSVPVVPVKDDPTPPQDDNGIKTPVVWTRSISPENGWKTGDIISITFEAKINPANYIYSAIPPATPANLPTTFELDPETRGIEVVGELQEEGDRQKMYDDVFDADVQYFKKTVTFIQQLKVTEENPAIVGYLSYQVCDSVSCIPAKEDFSYGAVENAPASISPGDKKINLNKNSGKSLWQVILESFAWGFAALFTPCVFPMIPLTVSFFTKQQDGATRATGIRNAILYGLSIIFIYTILGILLSVIVGPDAMQRIANNPWVNVLFFLLLFVFGLSFLGMFEITLPSSWSTAMSKQSGRGGLIGIFFMALTLAIVSFSCTAPLVSSALFQAVDTGSYTGPILSMLAFSSALALPFALFALFPSWMHALPQSGGWLNAVKVTLGFLEIALALTYLSQADLIWHLGLLDREIMIGASIVIFMMLGLYLLGKIQLPHDSPVERLSVPRLMLAMCTFWFVLYLVPGLWGAPLKMLAGFLPKPNSDMGVMLQDGQIVSASGSSIVSEDNICTYPGKKYAELNEETPPGFCAFYDLDQGLEYARKHNKPILLDFTGHTCKNCRHVELNVWPDPVVKKYLTEDYVLVSLYTDDATRLDEIEVTPSGKKLRTVGDKWLQYQIDTYRSNTQPEYIVLDTENNQLLPSLGYTLDLEEYRGYLEAGLKAFREK